MANTIMTNHDFILLLKDCGIVAGENITAVEINGHEIANIENSNDNVEIKVTRLIKLEMPNSTK